MPLRTQCCSLMGTGLSPPLGIRIPVSRESGFPVALPAAHSNLTFQCAWRKATVVNQTSCSSSCRTLSGEILIRLIEWPLGIDD